MSSLGRGLPTTYHLRELEIARSPDDPRRIMPPIPAGCRRIIDVGCGIGQTLIASELPGAVACGVEPDIEALRFGRTISQHIQPVCGEAERLPVRANWAEFALARLSLPYTHIPEAVGEVYRVLAPGGQFWSVLHPIGMTLRDLLQSVLRFRGRDFVYRSYVLLNGITLHATGRQVRFPLSRQRCESFQTEGGMKRILRTAGFEAISITRHPFFIATARKPAASG